MLGPWRQPAIVDGWLAGLDDHPAVDDDERALLHRLRDARLAAVAGWERDAAVVHGDAHPGNVLLGPDGVTGFPDGTWARQTVTLRSNDRNVWQASEYSAPAGMPRETKGSDHDGVLSKQYKALTNVEISATYFGGGAPERFAIEGTSVPTDWTSGQPAFGPVFIACSVIQVTMGPVTVSTPTACAQTKFS